MKKAIFSAALLAIAAIALIASCKKSHNSNVTAGTPSLNQLFAGLRSTPQGLSVTAGMDTIVYGSKGTKLHFYTNSFKDASGATITGGTINLSLIEMYKPGDMIANRATTMVGGQILKSGGQITMTATLNGQPVYANKYGIGFAQSSPSTNTMALFYGGTDNADSVATWVASDTTQNGTMAAGTKIDSVSAGGGNGIYFLFDSCTNLHFTNCDQFWDSTSAKTSVSIVLPDTSFNPANTSVYLVLPSINAVMSTAESRLAGTGYTVTTNTMSIISEGQLNIVPFGMHYILVVMTNKNGQYYYYQTSGIIPAGGLVATAAMAQDTKDDIITKLQGL